MSRRPGFALLITLVATMALALLATSMLAIAAREAEVASALVARTRARSAAEGAVRAAAADWSTRRYQTLPAGGVVATTLDSGVSVQVRRLVGDRYLVEAVAALPGRGSPVVATSAALVATASPARISGAFPAAAAAEVEAVIGGDAWVTVDQCEVPAAAAAAAAVMAPTVHIEAGAAVAGEPAVAEHDPPELTPWLAAPMLRQLATIVLEAGAVIPGPGAEAGQCLQQPSSWGALSPAHPCHDQLPLIQSLADLEALGGEGRGLLVVEGDARLHDVQFEGAVLVRGHLTISAGTVIRGAVRARTVEVQGGVIRYDACALAAALSAGGLDGAFRPGERFWVPAF